MALVASVVKKGSIRLLARHVELGIGAQLLCFLRNFP